MKKIYLILVFCLILILLMPVAFASDDNSTLDNNIENLNDKETFFNNQFFIHRIYLQFHLIQIIRNLCIGFGKSDDFFFDVRKHSAEKFRGHFRFLHARKILFDDHHFIHFFNLIGDDVKIILNLIFAFFGNWIPNEKEEQHEKCSHYKWKYFRIIFQIILINL